MLFLQISMRVQPMLVFSIAEPHPARSDGVNVGAGPSRLSHAANLRNLRAKYFSEYIIFFPTLAQSGYFYMLIFWLLNLLSSPGDPAGRTAGTAQQPQLRIGQAPPQAQGAQAPPQAQVGQVLPHQAVGAQAPHPQAQGWLFSPLPQSGYFYMLAFWLLIIFFFQERVL